MQTVPDPPPARPDVLCFLSACYSPVPPCTCFSLTHPVSFPPGRPRRLLIPSAHNCISQSRLRCCVRLCRVTDCSRRCSRRTPERNSLTRRGAIFTASWQERVDACINTMVDKYEGYIVLLCTIPGADRGSAITILSEIGVDMTPFGSSKRLSCWIGRTPGNNESAGKKKSVRISRTGVYLRPALAQVAHAAAKDKLSPCYALKYERIAKRWNRKRAIIAIARMILTAVFVILSNLEEWNPVDLYKIDMPKH